MSPGPILFGHQATVSSADGPGSRLGRVHTGTGGERFFGVKGDVTSFDRVTPWKKSSCIHTRTQRSACKAAKAGEAFLLRGLLLRSVVFDDHENKFPCSVTSLVDTRKQIAYPPHKLKRVVKLLTVLRTWVRLKATADQGQCSFSVAAPLSSPSQS